jgi:hypothetical protein
MTRNILKASAVLLTLLPIQIYASDLEIIEQCSSKYNHLKKDDIKLKELNDDFENGKEKSMFFDPSTLPSSCTMSKCIAFNYEKLDFIERKFNDSMRNGIYTIVALKNGDSRCNFTANPSDEVCYASIKNENNEIKSKYGFNYKVNLTTRVITFEIFDVKNKNMILENNTVIFRTSSENGKFRSGICPSKFDIDSPIGQKILDVFPNQPR